MSGVQESARILVIEDNKVVRDFMRMILEGEGHDVELAADGESGLASCLAQPPDLVFCDLMLPGVDGLEVIRRAKETEEMKQIPFILVSTKQDRQTIREGMQTGARDFLSKPFTRQDIVAAVRLQLA
ncbi:MAG: response regulator [Spirochaetia bacterium]|nr:response regulator [Spirochaetia bacterium]